jgi:dihydrofolate reductase
MRKIVLYIAASLDGYIARPDGNIDWLTDKKYNIPDEDFGYSAFIDTIGTTLMGNSTYKAVLGMDMPFPYSDKKNYVFSRSEHADTEYASFVKDNAVDFIEKLKEQPGKDIWLIGGGELNALVLNAGMLDEIILTYIPITYLSYLAKAFRFSLQMPASIKLSCSRRTTTYTAMAFCR